MKARWLKVRNKLWFWCVRNHDMGCILPWYLVLARAVLYPVDSFQWFVCTNSRYDIRTDTYIIGGVRFSYKALMALAHSDGEIFRVHRAGEWLTVTMTRIHRTTHTPGENVMLTVEELP